MFGKISLFSVISVGLISFAVISMQTESTTANTFSEKVPQNIPVPVLTTDTWGVFDPDTGMLIGGENTETSHAIASVVKLFTAAAVMDSSQKDERFEISAADVNTEGRAGKLTVGASVTPYELLFPLLIESSNDAAAAIARHMGSVFTQSIQNLPKKLALSRTVISESTGLSEKNVSTVADLAIFYAYLGNTYPHILDITELNTYLDTRTGYGNSNPARTLRNFTGGKQGYTDVAGRTFVGTFTLSDTNEEMGIVLLQSDHLLEDINALLAYAKNIKESAI